MPESPLIGKYNNHPFIEIGDSNHPVYTVATEELIIPSSRHLLGDRVNPFALFTLHPFDRVISSARWRVDGGGWSAIAADAISFKHAIGEAANFIASTFGKFFYELEITDSASVVLLQGSHVIIALGAIAQETRTVRIDNPFFPFATIELGDASLISTIEYAYTGPATLALTAIPRKVFFTGTHTGVNNSVNLIDSAKNFNNMQLDISSYIIKNTTDVSEGALISIVDSITLQVILTGGTDDDFDTADVYNIVDGGPINVLAAKLNLTLTLDGIYPFQLKVTDTSAGSETLEFPIFVYDPDIV